VSKKPDPSKPTDLVRRWYRTEAALADPSGYVKNHDKGEVIPPHNGVCAKVLQSREGFRRCNLSVRNLVARLNEPGAPNRVVHSCHLGLGMVGVRQPSEEDTTFCCGVSLKAIDAMQRRTMADKLVTIGIEPSKVSGYDEIRPVDAAEQERLGDLLSVCTRELATNHETKSKMEAHAKEISHSEAGDLINSLKDQVRQFEQELISKGLIRTHWNRLKLARQLGISRTTLLAKMAEYGLREGPMPKAPADAPARPRKKAKAKVF
jgi:DNA-binding protein Fis